MGDNAVYKKQFYTKLVTSCHFMFLYFYICSFFFLFVLLKTHESKRSYSRSELTDTLLILFPPADMWFHCYCQKTCLGHEMIKDQQQLAARGQISSAEGRFFFSQKDGS